MIRIGSRVRPTPPWLVSLGGTVYGEAETLPLSEHHARRPKTAFDVGANVLDITRAGRLVGWSPKVSLEEGLLRHIAYLKQQPAAHRVVTQEPKIKCKPESAQSLA